MSKLSCKELIQNQFEWLLD